jgi:aarF domain-containing kinase
VHADPHHANVFVRKSKINNQAEIVLLDHGFYETVKESDRKLLCKLWKAIVLKEEQLMKEYSKQLNVTGKTTRQLAY